MSSLFIGDIDTLGEYATTVLSICEDALATTDEGTPDLAYVSAGVPAYDCCPALIVYVDSLAEAATSPIAPQLETFLRVENGAVIVATLIIDVLRCSAPLSNNGLPSASAQQQVALTVYQDGWAVWNGMRAAIRDGQFGDSCIGVAFNQGVPIREQGGCVGWSFSLTAPIPGIP